MRELLVRRAELEAKADSALKAAEAAKRALTEAETTQYNEAMAELTAVNAQIKMRVDIQNSRIAVPDNFMSMVPGNAQPRTKKNGPEGKVVLSAEYHAAFWKNVGNLGRNADAALYEGDNAHGGYFVPVTTDGQIVPLAPNEFAIRQLARVVPTNNDVKIAVQITKASAAAKAESVSATDTAHGFTDTSGTLAQVTLSSHMAGGSTDVSWEAAQDVNLLEALATPDLINAVQEYEEGKFISGAGTTEPQGVLTGADFGHAHSSLTLDAILDLIGTLKETYQRNASFLLARPTAISIRKAQLDANLFDPVWTRNGNQDYLYGYPVFYSSSMPAIAQAAKVMVFGDFKAGFLIGDRNNSAISVKVLDQPKAQYGLITVLAYRRTDSLVRRSEALKTFVIDSGS